MDYDLYLYVIISVGIAFIITVQLLIIFEIRKLGQIMRDIIKADRENFRSINAALQALSTSILRKGTIETIKDEIIETPSQKDF